MKAPLLNEIPKFLYKYRSLSTEQEMARLEQLLLGNEMYWASPSEFNDPFDCAPIFDMPPKAKMRQVLRRVIKNRGHGEDRRHRRMKEKQARHLSREHYEKMLAAMMPEMNNETAIYSLGADETSVLMWSHYACSHRGVCVRFRRDVLLNYFMPDLPRMATSGGPILLPVHYSIERPIIVVGLEESLDLLRKIVLEKADFWSYEKEWRLIHYRGLRGVRECPPVAIDAVILGANIPETDETRIRSMVAKRRAPTRVLRAAMMPRQFRLEIAPAD
jgi:hypothetical protein